MPHPALEQTQAGALLNEVVSCPYRDAVFGGGRLDFSTLHHMLIYPFMQTDLWDYKANLMMSGRQLNTDELLELLYQMMKGVHFLHSLDITHRDLKLENLMLTNPDADGMQILRIIDLGLAIDVNAPPVREFAGTLMYLGPEILESSADSAEISGDMYLHSDCWASGIILGDLHRSSGSIFGNDDGSDPTLEVCSETNPIAHQTQSC